MLAVAYMIQHIVTLAAYSIHTVKWAAANFTVCYILLPGVSAHPAEKKKKEEEIVTIRQPSHLLLMIRKAMSRHVRRDSAR